MTESDGYKELTKEIRTQFYKEKWNKIKHALNIFPEKKDIPNNQPDISTITEKIAFIIDDEVVEIMYCQPKLAAILLSEPKIINVNSYESLKPGWQYKDGDFVEPVIEYDITHNRDVEAIEKGLPTFKEYQENVKSISLPTFKEFADILESSKK